VTEQVRSWIWSPDGIEEQQLRANPVSTFVLVNTGLES
jgi:hypothetical protein